MKLSTVMLLVRLILQSFKVGKLLNLIEKKVTVGTHVCFGFGFSLESEQTLDRFRLKAAHKTLALATATQSKTNTNPNQFTTTT